LARDLTGQQASERNEPAEVEPLSRIA
jgi:hypothetical protein